MCSDGHHQGCTTFSATIYDLLPCGFTICLMFAHLRNQELEQWLLQGGSGGRRHHHLSLPSLLAVARAERRHNPCARRDGGGGVSSSLECWERVQPLWHWARPRRAEAMFLGADGWSLEEVSSEQAWLPGSVSRAVARSRVNGLVKRRRRWFLGVGEPGAGVAP
jgi:hypothetical protein